MSKAEPIELVGDRLSEVLRPAAQISGTTVVGLAVASAELSEKLSLSAAFPRDWAGRQFCLTMISADGLYEASNTYRIAGDWAGGEVSVDYPTSYPKKLRALSAEELALRVHPGDCAVQRSDAFLTVGWRQSGSMTTGTALRLFINSFQADEVYLFVGADPLAEPVFCRAPEARMNTAFDFVCDIPIAQVEGGTEVEINRVSSGQLAPPAYVTLELAPQ